MIDAARSAATFSPHIKNKRPVIDAEAAGGRAPVLAGATEARTLLA
jgi:hypothetical protein